MMAELSNKQIIFLAPLFKETIWGGNKLAEKFNYNIPSESTGECWAIAANKNGDCRIVTDGFENYTLSRLWKEHRELFGNLENDVFPLLIKILDAKTDLSIQVHPDDDYSAKYENGSLGKTECWYVLDCDDDAAIIIGHNAKNKDELELMVNENKWSDLLREVKIKKGDFFQIESGCIHAIKGGTMIFETQQNSDITYRVYDYGRLSADGKPRELHTKKALDVITVPFKNYSVERNVQTYEGYTREMLVKCDYYSLDKINITSQAEISQRYNFMNVSVIDGNGTVDGFEIKKGMHFILPNKYGIAEFKGNMELLISYI